MTDHKGSCLCGKTSFTLTGPEPTIAICHCTHCQKQTASAFSLVAIAPRANFAVVGPMRKYVDKGDSGNVVNRWFCGECGSPIMTEIEVSPDTAYIKAGAFDKTDWLKP